MSTTTPTPSDAQLDALASQILEHIRHGGLLGDLVDLSPRDYELLYAMGHNLYVQARYADAARLFGFLVMHNHLERRYTVAYAAALQMTQDYGSAISLYTLAAIMDLTDPAPCFHTCECLAALGLKAEALDGLAMVVQQCQGEAHASLRARAQAMLALLSANTAAQAPTAAEAS